MPGDGQRRLESPQRLRVDAAIGALRTSPYGAGQPVLQAIVLIRRAIRFVASQPRLRSVNRSLFPLPQPAFCRGSLPAGVLAATLLPLRVLAVETTAAPGGTAWTAASSDPRVLGWMQGSPPPPGRVICFGDAQAFSFPQLRWSVCHSDQLMPTRAVSL